MIDRPEVPQGLSLTYRQALTLLDMAVSINVGLTHTREVNTLLHQLTRALDRPMRDNFTYDEDAMRELCEAVFKLNNVLP